MIKGQSLIVAESGQVLLSQLRIADTFFDRFRGLMGASPLHPDEGLWLEPSNSVHMFWMRFALDIVFLDRAGTILRLVPNLKPWRISPIVRGANVALELAPGSIERLGLQPGMRLAVQGPVPATESH